MAMPANGVSDAPRCSDINAAAEGGRRGERSTTAPTAFIPTPKCLRQALLISASRGSCLAVGDGDGAMFVCSAAPFAFNAAVLGSSPE